MAEDKASAIYIANIRWPDRWLDLISVVQWQAMSHRERAIATGHFRPPTRRRH